MKKLITRIKIKRKIREQEAHINSRKALFHSTECVHKLRFINRLKRLVKQETPASE